MGRTNSVRRARSKGNGAITDEINTNDEPIIINTYGRCKRRPLWECQEVSPRGPLRGSLVKVVTRHVAAITKTIRSMSCPMHLELYWALMLLQISM
jgi:hypothetical protein